MKETTGNFEKKKFHVPDIFPKSRLTCLVATSLRFLRVYRDYRGLRRDGREQSAVAKMPQKSLRYASTSGARAANKF